MKLKAFLRQMHILIYINKTKCCRDVTHEGPPVKEIVYQCFLADWVLMCDVTMQK